MIRAFLLILPLLAILSPTEAQYFAMFGDQSTGWYEYNDLQELGGKSTFTYYTVGDSVVNGETYHVVHYDWITEQDTLRDSKFGLYREDVANKKIYSLNSSSSLQPESLVYDFSKNVGDTVKLGVNAVLVVDSITQVIHLCDEDIATERNVFYLHDTKNENSGTIIWVEGIGNIVSFSLFDLSIDCVNKKEFLVCKMKDEAIEYHYNKVTGFEECPFEIPASNNNLPEIQDIKIFPNPSRGNIFISGNLSELHNADYTIFNMNGQALQRGKLSGVSTNEIQTEDLSNGVYFIEIFNRTQQVLSNRKFILAK